MKKLRTYISKTIKNMVYLFSVQAKIGVKGTLYQFLYSMLNAAKSFLWILLPKVSIDLCTAKENGNGFFVFLLTVSAAAWLLDLSIGITETLQSVYNLKFAHFFKKKIACKAMDMDYKETESAETLDTMERAYDVAYELSGSQITDFLTCLFKLVTLVYIVSTLNPVIAAAALFIVIVIYIVNKKAAKRNHFFDRMKAPGERQKNYVEERVLDFGFAKDMRIFQSAEYMMRKFDAAAARVTAIQRKQDTYNFAVSLIKTILNTILNGGVYVYLIFRYSFGLVALSSFTMYLSAVSEFYGAIDALFFLFIDFYETNMNLDELKKFFELPETIAGGENGEEKEESDIFSKLRSIEFRNVSFTYPGQTEPALKNISLKINMGETVMLAGENGAGKSTFVKLLLRLYDADSGEILVNGVNVKKIAYSDYIRLFEPVFQDVNLFAYMLGENISFRAAPAGDDALMRSVLEQSGVLPLVEELPYGLNTYCTKEFEESGYNFSGGEKQKLSIARALYRCGKILVLDEPNSMLDAIAERNLFTGIREMAKDKIVIFISHRLTASKFCDHIYIFDEGSIIEEGSFEFLAGRDSVFKKLFDTQAIYYR